MQLRVIFDMDGVIFDSERVSVECWLKSGEAMGLPREPLLAAVYGLMGTNDEETRRRMEAAMGGCPGFDYEKLESGMWRAFAHEAEKGLPLKPGVHAVMDALDGHSIPFGLASSTRREAVERELRDAGLMNRFAAVVCGDEVDRGKPDPQIFLRCCEKMGGIPADTFVLEDSYNGIRAAHAAGMRAIMVPDLLEATPEMERLAQCICPDLAVAGAEILRRAEAGRE